MKSSRLHHPSNDEEAITYDEKSENATFHDTSSTGPNQEINSNLSTLLHILAVSIGPTVFIFPHAFDMIGYVFSIVCIFLVGLFYTFNVHILLKCSSVICQRRGLTGVSFAEVVRYSFDNCPVKFRSLASYAYNAINMLMVISWSGELCFNVVFMCSNLNAIINQYLPQGVNIHQIVIYSLMPCILVSSVPGFKLSFLSAAATTIDVVFIGAVLFECCYTYDPSAVISREPVKNLIDVPLFLSTVFFTLNFTGIVLPLRNKVADKTKFDSRFGTFSTSVIVICAVNALFGLVGYLRYGDLVKNMVTLNLPQTSLIQIMIGIYCLAIYFSYPILFLVIFEIVWKEWIRDTITDTRKIFFYEFLTRITINLVIFACILCLPKLNWFINIGGLMCAVCDSIMVPSLVQILVLYGEKKETYKLIVIRNTIIIASGLILFYFGIQACVQDLATDETKR